MPVRWSPVFSNGFGCDLCVEQRVVGWTRIHLPNRSTGGTREVVVYMVCAEHMVGEPVYPVHFEEVPAKGRVDDA